MELPKLPADDMLYFHARYRQEFPAKPFSPYVIFDGRGEGHYVGTVFSIQCSYGELVRRVGRPLLHRRRGRAVDRRHRLRGLLQRRLELPRSSPTTTRA